MMSGWDDDDDDDDADIVFESWGDLEDDDDEEVILEESEEAESLLQQAAAWDRSAAMRKTTKKALAAVRRIFQDGRITKQEKRKLIFSVIRSASQDEISLVEQAYDLLVQRDVGGQGESCMEEFADQCRVIATMYVQAMQSPIRWPRSIITPSILLGVEELGAERCVVSCCFVELRWN